LDILANRQSKNIAIPTTTKTIHHPGSTILTPFASDTFPTHVNEEKSLKKGTKKNHKSMNKCLLLLLILVLMVNRAMTNKGTIVSYCKIRENEALVHT